MAASFTSVAAVGADPAEMAPTVAEGVAELYSMAECGAGGAYAGGGGGGGDSSDGGSGGFGGGGGGTGKHGGLFGLTGGSAGFGGGAGAGIFGTVSGGGPGKAGCLSDFNGNCVFAGGGVATEANGGGGAGLGGAIFNDGGSVMISNSTFVGNSAEGGHGGGFLTNGAGGNGTPYGGAILSLNGSIKIDNVTISGNFSRVSMGGPGTGGGLAVVQQFGAPLHFDLRNSILSNNGLGDCTLSGFTITGEFSGNLIQNNDSANPCPASGIVATGDPHLGGLQYNGGLTPTLAISSTSPAYGSTNAGLPRDQRGQPRPSPDGHGFDIGAFELCTPNRPEISPFPCFPPVNLQTFALTMQVSPAGGGTTDPAASSVAYDEPINSVIPITATPAAGYTFTGWTGGGIVNPTNSSTFVVMSQSQTVTANFQLCACAQDVSGLMFVTFGGFTLNPITGRLLQNVTLTNGSAAFITGPISLVLDNLSSNASLANATGTTDALAPPAGSPYINSSTNLAPGQAITVTLQFTDPSRSTISYTTRVLAGPGSR